eukprot:TRINITY_DN9104_c0_g1_i1.p1 TRINITY_DN9104_c0_g1~~TRINITY_DN9104_c0_g1_i1.p1  ORF type:complete len:403 (+),score=109.12 TRINITY_DN9104_c0_g1_i1:79-1287(+)
MYGGDEIGALVLDVGSAFAKAGYAGEDTPRYVFPTSIGRNQDGTKCVGDPLLRKEHMTVERVFDKGILVDFEGYEKIIQYTWDRLGADPKETPILLAEPSFNTKAAREKMTEIMFETFGCPAAFIAKNAVLSAFSVGKSTALVLDSGAGVTSAVPVLDGYVLQKNIFKSNLSGNFLTQEYKRIIEEAKKIEVKPHYLIKMKKEIHPGAFEVTPRDAPNTTDSFRDYAISEIVRDIKETVCRVSEGPFDEEANASIPGIPYELPDGTTIDLGTDRFSIPELAFNPTPLMKREGAEDFVPIQNLIQNCITKCDADVRRELSQSIIVTGGTSLLPQFAERLHREVTERMPQYKIKILAPNSPIERKYSTWIGGSILGSLGTFHQLWMSKEEYLEHGRTLVERKCP